MNKRYYYIIFYFMFLVEYIYANDYQCHWEGKGPFCGFSCSNFKQKCNKGNYIQQLITKIVDKDGYYDKDFGYPCSFSGCKALCCTI